MRVVVANVVAVNAKSARSGVEYQYQDNQILG